MGKVTIIVQAPDISSSEMERMIHEQLNCEDLLPDYHTVEVFVVPDSEEYPDLS